MRVRFHVTRRNATAGLIAAAFVGTGAGAASARDLALQQAIAQAAAGDKVLAAYYKETGYDTLWTGRDSGDRLRRKALLTAFEDAADHGLPTDRYPASEVEAALKRARSAEDKGKLDVQLSKMFLQYAEDIATGVLDPRYLPAPLDDEIGRRPARLDRLAALRNVARGNSKKVFELLPPQSEDYTRLVAAKIEMQKIAETNGWGAEVRADRLEPGDSGAAVVALRDRLYRMGFMKRSVSASYDDRLTEGVKAYQAANGLAADGVAGQGTLAMINTSPDTRLGQIIVALERLRWMNFDRGDRYVEVNIPDFHARLIERGRVVWKTRVVVGQAKDDMRTPEFSDEMEYMVVNPSWYVPREIAVAEYLPMLQEDPMAVSHLNLLDDNGNLVDRRSVDFASLNEDTWDFLLKEPPSQGNALGLVKFMFPNKYNIYLHDTPQKSLFNRESRAYSHGCIRLQDPFGFAYEVLGAQTSDPKGTMQQALKSSEEYYINLKKHLPVHLIYLTARVDAGGQMEFRRDIYGRDRVIFNELRRKGVELRPS